jgi:hypothetical protein
MAKVKRNSNVYLEVMPPRYVKKIPQIWSMRVSTERSTNIKVTARSILRYV